MYQSPENTPIWISSSITTLATSGHADLSIQVGGAASERGEAPRSQKQFAINSVIITVLDSDTNDAYGADFVVHFYGTSDYDETTIADDKYLGYVELTEAASAQSVASDLYYYADHVVELNYIDMEADATGRPRVHCVVQETSGMGELEIGAEADEATIRLCLVPC